MLQLMAYVLLVGVALTVVATLLERIAEGAGRSSRSIWAMAMLLSIVIPAVLMLIADKQAGPVNDYPAQAASVVTDEIGHASQTATSSSTAEIAHASGSSDAVAETALWPLAGDVSPVWQLPRPGTRALLISWATMSGALLLLLATAHLALRRRAGLWSSENLRGQPVLVSEDTGPALVGVLRPQIVVPRWLLSEPEATQDLILQHEQQHMAAHDPLLLRACLLAAIALPWNLPLWLQWRKLRLAIELDCDARVLGVGADPANYAEVLLAVVQRASAAPLGMVTMTEPASGLEHRIGNLLARPRRYAIPAVVLAVVAIGAVMIVARMDAPTIPGSEPERSAVLETPEPSTQAATTMAVAGQGVSATDNVPIAAAAVAPPAEENSAPLRLLPPDSRAAPVREAALQALFDRYPQLSDGSITHAPVAAAVVLRWDLSVYLSDLRVPQPPHVMIENLSYLMPQYVNSATAVLNVGTQIPDRGKLTSKVSLRYALLPEHYSETRNEARVQQAVLAARPDLLLPMSAEHINRVTVSMTESGEVDRLYSELRPNAELGPVPPFSVARWAPIFEPLGLRAQGLGLTGVTYAHADPSSTATGVGAAEAAVSERQWMIVRYAYPRRPGEPVGGAPSNQQKPDTFTATAQAIVERHLPDAFTTNVEGAEMPAIALSRNGEVLATTLGGVKSLQDKVGPRIELTQFAVTQFSNAQGVRRQVLFGWEKQSEQ
jgi:beta-lactamase regulating signal transducer with metallopeptidase domain